MPPRIAGGGVLASADQGLDVAGDSAEKGSASAALNGMSDTFPRKVTNRAISTCRLASFMFGAAR